MNKKSNIIKEINLNKIRKALKEVNIATKPQLSQLTSLSVVTVNSLVNTLIDIGEIRTDETQQSEGGRPALTYRYNANYRLVLVIYMHEHQGQDKAFYRVIDLRGEVIDSREQVLTEVHIGSFDSHIEELIHQYPQIQAICFGIPGHEVNQRLVIIDYEKLKGESLSGYINEKFMCKVWIENDINAAVFGYAHINKISKCECIVGFYFPEKYPPGGGIYLNGKIYKGRDGLAGEIKYLPLGIDWEFFDYNRREYSEYMVKTIQTFLCTYNPNRIILYGEGVKEDVIQEIVNRCASQVEKILLPDLIISTELNKHFEIGIKEIALSMINTEYDINQ